MDREWFEIFFGFIGAVAYVYLACTIGPNADTVCRGSNRDDAFWRFCWDHRAFMLPIGRIMYLSVFVFEAAGLAFLLHQ